MKMNPIIHALKLSIPSVEMLIVKHIFSGHTCIARFFQKFINYNCADNLRLRRFLVLVSHLSSLFFLCLFCTHSRCCQQCHGVGRAKWGNFLLCRPLAFFLAKIGNLSAILITKTSTISEKVRGPNCGCYHIKIQNSLKDYQASC